MVLYCIVLCCAGSLLQPEGIVTAARGLNMTRYCCYDMTTTHVIKIRKICTKQKIHAHCCCCARPESSVKATNNLCTSKSIRTIKAL